MKSLIIVWFLQKKKNKKRDGNFVFQTSWGLNRSVYPEPESRGAVVVTLESTIISACSSGSLVSKGRFVGLCLRFAEDFEASLDDWKPNTNDTAIMNLCVVSEGTYEVTFLGGTS